MADLYRNELLAQLPGTLRGKIQTQSRVMILRTGQILSLPDQTTTYVYFPETALLALSLQLPSASPTEIMSVGVEGMLVVAGRHEQPTSLVAMAISGGTALRIAHKTLRQIAAEHPPLQMLLTTYSDYTIQQLCQTIACYRHHSIKQQVSRWLLAHDDRFPNMPMFITHAALAWRLGVRREAVSKVANYLQKIGALHYQRGQIKWIDRSILLTQSCECYMALHSIERKKAQHCMLGSGWGTH